MNTSDKTNPSSLASSTDSLSDPTHISKMSIATYTPQWQMSANDTPVLPHQKSNIRLPSINELMASFSEQSTPRTGNSYYSSHNIKPPITPIESVSTPPYYPQQYNAPLSPPLTASSNDSSSYSTSSSSSGSISSSTTSSIQMLLDASSSADNMVKNRSHSISSTSSNGTTSASSSNATSNATNNSTTGSSISPPPFSASPYSPPLKRRGNLPRAVTDILRNWLSSHLHYPYPTEQEKIELMKQTGLSLNQVSNWFINARRRRVPAIYKHSGMINVPDRPRRAVSDNTSMSRSVPPPPPQSLSHQRFVSQLHNQSVLQAPPLPVQNTHTSNPHYSPQSHIPPQWKP